MRSVEKTVFLGVVAPDYPWYTPYQFAGNKPIWAIDLDGLEEAFRTEYFDPTFGHKRIKYRYNLDKKPKDDGIVRYENSDGTFVDKVASDSDLIYLNKLRVEVSNPNKKRRSLEISIKAPLKVEQLEGKDDNTVIIVADEEIIKIGTKPTNEPVENDDEHEDHVIFSEDVTVSFKDEFGIIPFYPNERRDLIDPNNGHFPAEPYLKEIVDVLNSDSSIKRIKLGGTLAGGSLGRANTKRRMNRALNNISIELKKLGLKAYIDIDFTDIKYSKEGGTDVRITPQKD